MYNSLFIYRLNVKCCYYIECLNKCKIEKLYRRKRLVDFLSLILNVNVWLLHHIKLEQDEELQLKVNKLFDS